MSTERVIAIVVMLIVMITCKGSVDAQFNSGFGRVIGSALLAGGGMALGLGIGYVLVRIKRP